MLILLVVITVNVLRTIKERTVMKVGDGDKPPLLRFPAI